jgi:hypothetical protein
LEPPPPLANVAMTYWWSTFLRLQQNVRQIEEKHTEHLESKEVSTRKDKQTIDIISSSQTK